MNRRTFLVTAGGAGLAVVLGSRVADALGSEPRGRVPEGVASMPANGKSVVLVATDGWMSMPAGSRALAPWYPDVLASEGTDTYTFGFRDVTGLSRAQAQAQRGVTQASAPLLWVAEGEELWVTVSNLGLSLRPDLVDSHTVHWHGFRNAIPYYDGVPETSISVPIGSDFTYVYRPSSAEGGAAGTYMYHCHFEDVEHVTMGMTGIVFVTPPKVSGAYPKFAYTDDPEGTAFDRQYAIILTEIDSRAHFNDAHIQETDWTTFTPNFWLMNGRAWPDTIEAPGTTAADGTPVAPAGADHLAHQPNSSRIVCAPGERVLVRLANLGFQEQSLSLPGIPMTIVGSDARHLGIDTSSVVDTVDLGPGESRDVILTAPEREGAYPFFNRDMGKYPGVDGDAWSGGQRTEVLVKASVAGHPQPADQPNYWSPSWL